ncbi:TNF receptor-associated factor 6-like [Scleropages formosus]|uniref:TNF receptor-associated factor n=1 Tax=Scleropages formosus TaxID=113540 RepID=A0A0P7V9U0_SCLFO|nr:TNF receptor-associated factor 6 [Scleropages formosus]XP_029107648.1 TNF receptor-associated factor 6 [Scleropages formosus]KPP69926.1 TNF receptor-associated factor 6-like [Scleropages formosus]
MSQSCCETEKDGLEAACGSSELSACAASVEKERESCWSPSESPVTLGTSSSLQQSSSTGQTDLQGYDVEFDPPLESKYECPICLMALRAAVQTPCGHRFCRGCIEKSLRDAGQKCPVDNEVLLEEQLFPDNFAKREILSLTVRCPNTGCNHKMELRHLEAHVVQCQFTTVQCPLCQNDVWKSQLEEHTSLHCPRRPVSCPDCMHPYVYEESKLHEQQCPLAYVVCNYCSMELIRDQLASHCDLDCLKAPVACPFSSFGCQERMPRNDLAQHMQEFTQMHMRHMADHLRNLTLGSGPFAPGASCEERAGTTRAGPTSGPPCECGPSLQHMRETVHQLEGRLVRQDHQLRELSIHNDTQVAQLAELRRQVRVLEERARELEAQQCQGIYVWRVEGFSAHLRNQEAGQPVVIHSPGFYTGRPGYKLCLRLHLQTPNAPRCSNYISLFVHTMQGDFDSQLSWPFQGIIRLAILDQVDNQHHVEVMETKPDLLAFQRPTSPRNPKGFGYVTFMHLQALQQRQYVRDDTLLVRCEVTPRFDMCIRREGFQPRGPEASL